MEPTTIIYVDVKGYPEKTWYPVRAVHRHGNCYQVLESCNNFYSYRESWQFENGDVVRCESHVFYEGEIGLVARAKCECEAEEFCRIQAIQLTGHRGMGLMAQENL